MKRKAKLFFITIFFMLFNMGMVTQAVFATLSPSADFTFNASTGTITKYVGSSTNVQIPSQIGGANITVTGQFEPIPPQSDFYFNNGTITGYKGSGGVVEIPSSIDGVSVTAIGYLAFQNCEFRSITIPDSVTMIDNGAFQYCKNLTSVTIPNSVTSIGNFVFRGCSSLTNVIMPSGLTSIGNTAFRDCSRLTSIVIPSGVTTIGSWAFYECYWLSSIIIPEGVTSIGDYAFNSCSSLISVKFQGNSPTLGAYVFYNSNPGLTVYYQAGKKGFSNPWYGCKTVCLTNVIYDGNGSTRGTVPVDPNGYTPGSIAFVRENTENLTKTGYTFAGWNTAIDGSGTDYSANQMLIMGNENKVLYAKWIKIIYGDVDGNGSVNQIDYDLVKQFILGQITSFSSSKGFSAADFDNDGKITSKDYTLLLRYIRKNK